MIYQTIDEQIRSVIDREAFDELTRQRVVTEVLKALNAVKGTDLADNSKAGSGDLAENSKAGSGDLADNSKGGSGDLNSKAGSGDLGAAGDDSGAIAARAIVELVKASAAMGRAKTIVASLRALQGRLIAEDRAKLEKSLNNLETELVTIESCSGSYVTAMSRVSRRAAQSSANGRPVHLHFHLGA